MQQLTDDSRLLINSVGSGGSVFLCDMCQMILNSNLFSEGNLKEKCLAKLLGHRNMGVSSLKVVENFREKKLRLLSGAIVAAG